MLVRNRVERLLPTWLWLFSRRQETTDVHRTLTFYFDCLFCSSLRLQPHKLLGRRSSCSDKLIAVTEFDVFLLHVSWPESPSGKCAKLHTVAARNNRYHTAKSLYYCLFVPHVYGCYSSHISRPWWNAHSTSRYPQIPLNEQMFCIPFHPLKLSTFEQWNIKF